MVPRIRIGVLLGLSLLGCTSSRPAVQDTDPAPAAAPAVQHQTSAPAAATTPATAPPSQSQETPPPTPPPSDEPLEIARLFGDVPPRFGPPPPGVLLELKPMFMPRCLSLWKSPLVIRDAPAWKAFLDRHAFACKDFTPPQIDFSRYTLLAMRGITDCHGRVYIEVRRDDAAKLYRVDVREVDGGCRAARFWEFGYLVPRMPDEYQLEGRETRIDPRTHGLIP